MLRKIETGETADNTLIAVEAAINAAGRVVHELRTAPRIASASLR